METIRLLHVPVFTKSGTKIGRIKDIALDKSTQVVEHYMVHTGDFLPDFLTKELLIHRSQIVAFTGKGMIVEDAVAKEKNTSRQAAMA